MVISKKSCELHACRHAAFLQKSMLHYICMHARIYTIYISILQTSMHIYAGIQHAGIHACACSFNPYKNKIFLETNFIQLLISAFPYHHSVLSPFPFEPNPMSGQNLVLYFPSTFLQLQSLARIPEIGNTPLDIQC